jgi:hypothetical protein
MARYRIVTRLLAEYVGAMFVTIVSIPVVSAAVYNDLLNADCSYTISAIAATSVAFLIWIGISKITAADETLSSFFLSGSILNFPLVCMTTDTKLYVTFIRSKYNIVPITPIDQQAQYYFSVYCLYMFIVAEMICYYALINGHIRTRIAYLKRKETETMTRVSSKG